MRGKPVSFYVNKSVLTIVAVFFMAVGIEMFLISNMGADSVSVFVQGLQFVMQKLFDPATKYGTASLLFNGVFLVIGLFVSRKHIFVGTIITTFFLGRICNLIEPTMRAILPAEMDFVFRLLLAIAGQLVLCIGIGLQIATRFGQGAPNAVLFAISDLVGIPFKYIRIIFEAICVVAGWLMGGVVGLGTLICVVTTGPITSFLARLYNRTFLKAMGLDDPLNEMKPQKTVSKKEKVSVS